MSRSAGITVSAVVVLIGSAFTILGGAMTVLGSVFLLKSSQAANVPVNSGYFVAIDAVMFFVFGGWGLAAGISLINLNKLARISSFVLASNLVLILLPTAGLLT